MRTNVKNGIEKLKRWGKVENTKGETRQGEIKRRQGKWNWVKTK